MKRILAAAIRRQGPASELWGDIRGCGSGPDFFDVDGWCRRTRDGEMDCPTVVRSIECPGRSLDTDEGAND